MKKGDLSVAWSSAGSFAGALQTFRLSAIPQNLHLVPKGALLAAWQANPFVIVTLMQLDQSEPNFDTYIF